MKPAPVLAAFLASTILAVGCGNRQANRPAAPGILSASSSVTPGISGLLFPVAGGTLPDSPELLPGAPRDYRGGVHEGVDLYTKSGTSAVPCGEPVLNSSDGWVIRADTNWKAMTEPEYNSITQRLKKEHDEDLLDRLRGRQAWIRTADGITIRYCHLQSISPGIEPGIRVNQGVVLGTVGNTGTADGSRTTARNCHLHMEVWMPDGKFLGQGMPARDARTSWMALFSRPSINK